MTGRLDAKVIIVSGGSSGMGAAVARRAASEGARVVIGARGADAGERVAKEIQEAGGQAVFQATDVTVEADVERLVDTAVTSYGRLDGAFNNAGGVVSSGSVPDIDPEDWHADLELNLTSVFYNLKYQLPALLAAGGGAVVNNASVLGVTGSGGMSAYTAAKHGVVGLTRSAAMEVAARAVRVNALVTHAVDTPMFRGMVGGSLSGAQAAGFCPAARLSTPEEVAAFVAFLLSDEAGFITGAALAIDGGATAQ